MPIYHFNVTLSGEGETPEKAWDDAIEGFIQDAGPCPEADEWNIEENRFRNHYKCPRCGDTWTDDWSAMCDDECPSCGTICSPYQSDDLNKEGGD